MLTGHMLAEATLSSQTRALGEAMRSYRSFLQPGIDMLCDKREYSTAKQAQSAGSSIWTGWNDQRAVRCDQLGFRFQGT